MWFIRGIDLQGNAYGEIRTDVVRKLAFRLSAEDAATIQRLVAAIETGPAAVMPPQPGWRGLLAEGDVNAPSVIAYYYDGRDNMNDVEKPFRGIVRILDRYLSSAIGVESG